MNFIKYGVWVGLGCLLFVAVAQAQESASTAPLLSAPRWVQFSGVLQDAAGQPLSGVQGVTFALYQEQQGGAALWLETQNVALDEQGRYAVLLGATTSEGLPLELFTSNEARWLGVQVNLPDEVEQPRSLLVSVPYALKAADAETLGGRPASAFVLAADNPSRDSNGAVAASSGGSDKAGLPVAAMTDGLITAQTISGTTGNLAKFTGPNPDDLGNSVLFEDGSGRIGLNTVSPQTKLQINGNSGDSLLSLVGGSGAISESAYLGVQSRARFGFDASRGAVLIDDRSINGITTGKNIVFDTGAAERMRIANTGRVGIGTNNPQTALDVFGVIQENDGANGVLFLERTPSLARLRIGGASDVNFEIQGPGNANRFTVTTAGKVGIGTNSPTEKLDVAGNLKVSGNIISPTGSLSATVSSGTGVSGSTSSTSDFTAGVIGNATGISGQTRGVVGTTSSTSDFAAGVLGAATGVSGQTHGVYGFTSSTTQGAAGVLGEANTGSGIVRGVIGTTNSITDNAVGVFGSATATTGNTVGVRGNTASTTNNAAGVVGNATATSGQTRGVWGQTSSTSNFANGVRGEATGSSGETRGVFGSTSSTTNNAAGVFGSANASSGQTFGVQGRTGSTTDGAAGVQGSASGLSGRVYGVRGNTSSTTDFANGVQGEANGATGQTRGVFGSTISTTNFAAGVAGGALAATGQTFGVVGFTNSTTDGAKGVEGEANGATGETNGVRGYTNSTTDFAAGVSGEAHGETGWVFGVEGETSSSTDYSAGVLGSSSESGNTVGVLGVANSSTATAGVFLDFSGGAGKILSGRTGTFDPNTGVPIPPFPEVFRVEGDGDVVANIGDFQTLGAGKGIILKSPDGNTCARLSIANTTGAVVSNIVTCP